MMNSDETKQILDQLKNIEQRILEVQPPQNPKNKNTKPVGKWLLWIFVLAFIVAVITGPHNATDSKASDVSSAHIAAVTIEGKISSYYLQEELSMPRMLEDAFSNEESEAVLLNLNSPGGELYASFLIADKIDELKAQYPEKKVYALVRNMCASACYLIASTADVIVAHRTSFVGGIGVIFTHEGLNFNRLLKKYDIDVTTIRAGKHKGFLNPMNALDTEAMAQFQKQIDKIHEYFIDFVKSHRTLADHPDIFSGLMWVGNYAMDLKLIDHFGAEHTLSDYLPEAQKDLPIHYYENTDEVFDIGTIFQHISLLFSESEGIDILKNLILSETLRPQSSRLH